MSDRSPEHDAIAVPLQKYIDGIARHDMDPVAAAFHADATVSSHQDDRFAIGSGCRDHVDGQWLVTSKATLARPREQYHRLACLASCGVRKMVTVQIKP